MKQFYFLTLMLICSLVAQAQYTLQDADVTIVDGTIDEVILNGHTDIIIPPILQSQEVKQIGEQAFRGKGLTSVVFPATIEEVGFMSFYSNNLTSVTFEPNSKLWRIVGYAFGNNSQLNNIALPTSAYDGFVAYIGQDGQSYAAGDVITDFLTMVTVKIPYTLVDDDVTIVDGVITEFKYRGPSKDITIPSKLNGQTVTGIASGNSFDGGVFTYYDLMSVSFPSSIETIGSYAFYENYLIEVNFAANSNLQAINTSAFRNNDGLNGITLPNNTNAGFLCYNNNAGDVFMPGDVINNFTTRYFGLFEPYTLTSEDVVVVDGIIQSCSYRFASKAISIPEMLDNQVVTGIGQDVFNGKGLTSVTLPASIEVVAYKAFYNNSLTSVTFEANSQLRKIEALAFSSNNTLSGITLPTSAIEGFTGYIDEDGNKFAPGDQITNYYKVVTAQVPYTLADADVTIVDGVITEYLYTGASKDIIIPSTLNTQTVTGIADGTNFKGVFSDNDLTSVSFPASIETVGQYAFASNKLVEISFAASSNLRAINGGAFRNNNGLQRVVFPTHADPAFVCYKNSAGDVFNPGEAFEDLTDNYYALVPYTLTSDDVEVVDGYIKNCSYDFTSKSIIIPAELDNQVVTGIADYNYYGSRVFYEKGLVSITFPNTLEYIGNNALARNALTVVGLPASIVTIRSMAFYSNDLATVTFEAPSNIELIEGNAFYANTGVEIALPAHVKGENIYYLNDGTKYYASDVVSNSASDYVTTQDVSNSIDVTDKVALLVSPNPTQGELVITSDMATVIEVYSLTGAKVKSIEVFAGQSTKSIAELPNGVYLLRSNGKVITKLIKN